VRAAYGEGIRTFLPNALALRAVIDFGDLPVFSVAAYPAVLIGTKAQAEEEHLLTVADLVYPIRARLGADGLPVNVNGVRLALESLPDLLAEAAITNYPQSLLRKDGWILEDPALVRLFDRLMSQGTPLGEYVNGRMYRGLLTGLNEAFVIDEAKRAELISADPRSEEVIKPWLRGRDIKRWKPEWAGLYIIAIQNSGDTDAANPWGRATNETEAREIFRETYPAIHDHLSRWEEYPDPKGSGRILGLRPRADQGKWWWELRACAYYSEMGVSKIVWPEFARRMRFCLDQSGSFVNNKCYVTPALPAWALPVLNSRVIEFMLSMRTIQIRGGWLQLFDQYVRPLPLIEPAPECLRQLEAASRSLTAAPITDDLERETERLVRAYFGLSLAESSLLDQWIQRTGRAPGEEDEDLDA
jgi:hypothetical protein